MRLYSIAVYLFLYVPIGIIVLFGFNSGRHASDFQGLSVKWYAKALSNPFVIDALTTSLIIALSVAVLSSVMGTSAGSQRGEELSRSRQSCAASIINSVAVATAHQRNYPQARESGCGQSGFSAEPAGASP